MRTLRYCALMALGLLYNASALAEAPPEPVPEADAVEQPDTGAEKELAGSEDAVEEPAGTDDATPSEDTVGETPVAEADSDGDVHPDANAPADDAAPAVDGADCVAEPAAVRRFGQAGSLTLRLTDCKGEPNLAALADLSALAQPLTPRAETNLKLLNPQLLVRVQRLVEHFPGAGVEIVSGYRPHARPGSRHHSGDALDLHIDGVDNFELSEFARTLDATGVGYYPNSTFVHIDVRRAQTYWIDRSGPGERANYDRKAAAAVLANAAEPARDAKSTTRADDANSADANDDADKEATRDDDASGDDDATSDDDADTTTDGDSDSATPDADLQALADRALLVMNQALGLDDSHSAT